MDTKLIREICDSHDEAPDEESWEWGKKTGAGEVERWVPCTPNQALMCHRNNFAVRRKPATITRTVTVPKAAGFSSTEPGYKVRVAGSWFNYGPGEAGRIKAETVGETLTSLLRGDCE